LAAEDAEDAEVGVRDERGPAFDAPVAEQRI
jgi:hypothetical protein